MKNIGLGTGICLVLAASSVFADENGKKVYDSACFACHNAGIAGAPKLGDVAQWGPRMEQGSATMIEHSIKGFSGASGFMPAKGGRADLSDADIKAAVDYMLSQVKTSE